jgi:hypothetical protein
MIYSGQFAAKFGSINKGALVTAQEFDPLKDRVAALDTKIDEIAQETGYEGGGKANKIRALAPMQWNDGTPIPASSPFKLMFNTKIPDFGALEPGNYYKMDILPNTFFFAGCLEDGTKGVGLAYPAGTVELIYDDSTKTWLIPDGVFDLSSFDAPIPNTVTEVGAPAVPDYDFTGQTDIRIYSELKDLSDVDADLQAAKAQIAAEVSARAAADTALGTQITQETSDRQTAVSGEATARAAADTALGTQITQEATDRQSAVSGEASARAAADTALGAQITQEASDRQTAVSGEATAREDADDELGLRIDAVEGKGSLIGLSVLGDLAAMTPDNRMNAILGFAMPAIWVVEGEVGVYTYNSASPKDSTYVIDGVTHYASGIYNGSYIINKITADNPANDEWLLVNTPTTPTPIFTWMERGDPAVGVASDTYAGVAKLFNTVDGNSTEGSVTQAAVKTALDEKQPAISATGATNLLTAPTAAGGQPGTKAVSTLQPAISATGATNLLTAPTAAGGQPGTKAIADLQAKLVGSGTGQNIKTVGGTNILGTGDIPVGGGGESEYTFICDTDEKLAQWANATPAAGDTTYESVLVVGVLQASKSISSGVSTSLTPFINLNTTRTKRVTGAANSRITLINTNGSSNSYTCGIKGQINNSPATTEPCIITGVSLVYKGAGLIAAFYMCDGLSHCTGFAASKNSTGAYGFGYCTNLSHCYTSTAYVDTTYLYSSGFFYCDNLTNCTGSGNVYGKSFNYCNNLTNCVGNSGSGNGTTAGFYNCNNLTNCVGYANSSVEVSSGFFYCNNLTNCTGYGYGATYSYGFGYCNNLTNCVGYGNSQDFHVCTRMGYCRPITTGSSSVVYYNCKVGASSGTPADTAEGGWNSTVAVTETPEEEGAPKQTEPEAE